MYILIVNPFSSAEYLSNSFKSLGLKTIAIYTMDIKNLDSYYIPKPEWFDKQIYINNDKINPILEELKNYDINYVVNGTEHSTNLTDLLAQSLVPEFANDPNTSDYRMNKYKMHEALHENNLEYIKQIKFIVGTDNIYDEKFINFNYPCFVKPLHGAGSNGAFKVNSHKELCNFFSQLDLDDILKKLKVYLDKEESFEYLICEYIEGQEYLIDSFSHCGKHYISSIQHYNKKIINGNPIYRYCEIVKDSSIYNMITIYMEQVLNIIGLKNGFAHSEIFINDSNHKPVLIEVNPRISGAHGIVNKVASYGNLPTQPELLSNVVFKKPLNNHYINKQLSKWLVLFNFSEKPLPDLNLKLSNYTSCKYIFQIKPVGYIREDSPKALIDAVAIIICSSNDTEILDTEIKQILLQDEQGWT